MIIEIDGQKYPCRAESARTQMGNEVIRIISAEAPLAENGFKLYTEGDMIFDYSEFTNLYREEGTIREYTKVGEAIIKTKDLVTGTPESPYSILSRRISEVNYKVNDITPFEESKTAYFGEIEKVFYNVPEGNMTVFFDNYTGEYDIDRISDRVTVIFPTRLSDMTTVTLMVQK